MVQYQVDLGEDKRLTVAAGDHYGFSWLNQGVVTFSYFKDRKGATFLAIVTMSLCLVFCSDNLGFIPCGRVV